MFVCLHHDTTSLEYEGTFRNKLANSIETSLYSNTFEIDINLFNRLLLFNYFVAFDQFP